MLALATLVEEHSELLYRFAFRLSGSAADAEDLTQQTFLAALNHLEQLREPEKAKGWLCAILRNIYLKQYRQKHQAPTCCLDDMGDIPDEDSLNPDIDDELLNKALQELPEDFRSTIVLFYFGEFSYKEIAEQLEVPIGTVMSRLARGKSILKKRLTDDLSG